MSETAHAPDVSVLIPVYNASAYLRDSIASITAQTLTDIEIVAVNDGSTDGSGEVLDRIAAADPRVRVLHQPNGGIVAALNAGLALTRGRYIARMDGDDLAWPERLARQRDYLDANSDVVAVGTLYRAIDADGTVVHVQRAGGLLPPTDVCTFPPHVVSLSHPTLMVRGEAIRQLGGYRSFFPHAEDHDLFIRLARFGRLVVMPEVLLDYRVHGSSVSTRHRRVQLDNALRAQCAAMVEARGGPDVFAGGIDTTLAQMVDDRPGMPDQRSWATLRALSDLDYDLNRRDAASARHSLAIVAALIARHAPSLWRDRAITAMMRRTACATARLIKVQLRG